MSIFEKLFGGGSQATTTHNTQTPPISPTPQRTPATAAQSKDPKDSIPWDCIGRVSADNRAFFEMHKAALPEIFAKVRGMGSDPILMLVAFEQEKWRALLALLYKRPQNMFFTPESYLGSKPMLSNNGYCDVYVAPTVSGNPMQSAIFALERDWLVSELYLVKGMERMFIDEVRDKRLQVDGGFTTAVFGTGGMFVEHLPGSKMAEPVALAAGVSDGRGYRWFFLVRLQCDGLFLRSAGFRCHL